MLSGPPVTTTVSADQLLERFLEASPRQRRSLLTQVLQRAAELRPQVIDQLDRLDATGDDWAAGTLIQLLFQGEHDALTQAYRQRFPEGWLATTSASGINYTPLQLALIEQRYEEADRLTSEHLRQLAGADAVSRGYVYYSEVPPIAAVDLESIDRLWVVYSQGRFGFSVQIRLLRSLAGRWDQLWPRLGWKQGGVWTRYPSAFTWSLDAPEGHLPLVNQLRGVRLMDALLAHPGLQQRVAA
ncbi:MAG: GUN4 domain-containing protein [Cyanobacteria bacterium M_surface_10_m2_179]|nr:GUN4 domain-containing protein [Cyanobacteria bacterium M_surface_10_m2_179]